MSIDSARLLRSQTVIILKSLVIGSIIQVGRTNVKVPWSTKEPQTITVSAKKSLLPAKIFIFRIKRPLRACKTLMLSMAAPFLQVLP